MSKHEHFEELGALAAIGQISVEEDKELNSHLSDCPSCREAYHDYVRLLHKQLPQAAPRRWSLKEAVSRHGSGGELRERFFARARAEGINLSREGERRIRGPQAVRWNHLPWRHAAAAAGFVVVLVVGALAGRMYQIVPRSTVPDTRLTELARQNHILRSELAAVYRSIELKSADLAQLEEYKAVSAESVRKLQSELEQVRTEAARLNAALQQAQQENTGLAGANQQSEKLIADLRTKVEKLHLTDAENMASLVAQEGRIRELTQALQAESARVEQERQLTAVGQEVRKLMGARDLHIIDVHDVDGRGKSAKSFGRVFYAQGQSLIFYAFDLPTGKLTPAKYSFQAWGHREAVSQSARNLGTFQVDHHEQRRWVLKVNDPALLRDIDAVFVTAESLDYTREPNGQKLLYAYLGGLPNHP